MKKILVGIAILMVSLLLFGCGEQTDTGKGDIYVGGTTGLEFSFNTPLGAIIDGKDTIYEQDDGFNLELNIKNKGEATINAGDLKLKLTDILVDSYDNLKRDATNADQLNKIEKGLNVFEEEDISFRQDNTKQTKYKANIEAEFQPAVTAIACYPYSTLVSTTICFKNSKNKQGSCTNEGPKDFDSSGAPVQITAVTETPGNSKITVLVQVKNVGTGTIYKLSGDASKQCSLNDLGTVSNRDNENKFTVEVVSGGLTCDGSSAENPVRIGTDGTAQIRCEKTLNSDEAYTDQVTLRLNYQYEQRTSYTFYIKDKGTN